MYYYNSSIKVLYVCVRHNYGEHMYGYSAHNSMCICHIIQIKSLNHNRLFTQSVDISIGIHLTTNALPSFYRFSFSAPWYLIPDQIL